MPCFYAMIFGLGEKTDFPQLFWNNYFFYLRLGHRNF